MGAARTSFIAEPSAVVTALDFGAVARWMVACARVSWASGIPINCTVWAAATAVSSAQAAMKIARPSGVEPSKLRVMPTATGASLRPMTMMTGPVTMGGR